MKQNFVYRALFRDIFRFFTERSLLILRNMFYATTFIDFLANINA